VQQSGSRATNFLLDIRKNVEELLLENSDKHETQADCFMFTTIPSVLRAVSAVDEAPASVDAPSVPPAVSAVDGEPAIVTPSAVIAEQVIQITDVNHPGVSLNYGSPSSTPPFSLDARSSAMLSSEDDEELQSLESNILLPTRVDLLPNINSFLQRQQQLQSSTFDANADFLTLDDGTRVYSPTRTDVSSVSSLKRFVQKAHAGSASAKRNKRKEASAKRNKRKARAAKAKKRFASSVVQQREPIVPPQGTLALSTARVEDSDDDCPQLIDSTDDSDDSDDEAQRKPKPPRARKRAGAIFTNHDDFTIGRGEVLSENAFNLSVPSTIVEDSCDDVPDLRSSSGSDESSDESDDLHGSSCDDVPDLLSSSDSDESSDEIDDLNGSRGCDSDAHDCSPTLATQQALAVQMNVGSPEESVGSATPVLMIQDSRVVLNLAGVDSSRVLVDGGATIHATSRENYCFDINPCSVSIAGVGGVAFDCRKMGKLLFQPTCKRTPITLLDVHIAPEFPATFISESALVRRGCSILKNASGGSVTKDNGDLLFKLEEKEGLYYAIGQLCMPTECLNVISGPSNLEVPFECSNIDEALSWLLKCDLAEGIDTREDPHSMLLAKVYSKREVTDLLGRYHRRMSHISFKRVAAAFGIE